MEIHARPAALIANFAKAQSLEITVAAHGRRFNARSAVSLMALGVKHGDEITLIAHGDGAAAALDELKRLIVGIKEAPSAGAHAASANNAAAAQGRFAARADEERVRNVSVASSSGSGASRSRRKKEARRLRARLVFAASLPAVASRSAERSRSKPPRSPSSRAGKGIAHESAEFERARDEVRARLNQLAQHSQGAAKDVITAHLEFIDDWELVASARRAISRGKSAAFAWRRAVRDSADTLRALGDPRMSERVDDLIDLESQVLLALSGEAPVAIPSAPRPLDPGRRRSQAVTTGLAGRDQTRRHLSRSRRSNLARLQSWPPRWAYPRWWRSVRTC